ncbi:MAG TPA: hypothetical protein VH598_13115 [Verrucomicrobiae bacterium]|nr:hypothetical protein [Verrucomicrobiae bacterium]
MERINGFVRPMPANAIRNCTIEFRFKCPQDWDALEATQEAAVRFCQLCRQKVFFCQTDAEALDHAKRGNCVALPRHTGEGVPLTWVGMVGRRIEPPDVAAARHAYNRDNTITAALQAFSYSSRFCPECGFPVPDWYESCMVCGYKIGKIKFRPRDESGSTTKNQE